MTDISASERRLSAALDRIDGLLERGTWRSITAGPPEAAAHADSGADAEIAALRAENAELTDALTRLQTQIAATSGGVDADAEAGDAARLAAANEALADANRDLIEAQDGQGDEQEAALAALRAEIESLRASRAAEIGQLGEIVIELERLLGGNGTTAVPDGAVRPAAATAGLRFDAVYGEAGDDDDDSEDQRGGGI